MKDIIKFFTTLFSNEQTDLMKDLEIKRNFTATFGYVFWLFVLPFKVLTFLLSPTRQLIIGVEKLTLPIIQLFYAWSGKDNPFAVINATFERYVLHVHSKSNAPIKAELSQVDSMVSVFRLKNIITAVIVCLIFLFSAIFVGELVMIAAKYLSFGAIASALGFMSLSKELFPIMVILSLILVVGFIFFFTVKTLYLLVMAVKFVPHIFQGLTKIDQEEYTRFLNDVTYVTACKASQLYGADVSRAGLAMIRENFLVETSYLLDFQK